MDFKQEIVKLLVKETGLLEEDIVRVLSIPPQGLGDYAYPCFELAKQRKTNPLVISKELSTSISSDFLEKVEQKGPYVNFFLSKSSVSSSCLNDIFNKNFVDFSKKSGKIMVEYSSPNTNKPLHLGHLRNNTLGLAISNLLELLGYDVIKASLINDRGIHICKSMLAYKLFGENKTPKAENIKSDHFVGKMYVLFDKINKEKPGLKLEEQAQELLKKWESGDKETIDLWKKMNAWAIDGMQETYNLYGTKFDEFFLESEMFASGNKNEIIKEGLEKSVFKKEDNNAIVAVLEPELPNKVIVRGDGTSLYATNDLMLTQQKFEKFNLDKSIWVVANEQDLYFKQLFKIFEKLKRPWAKNCYHLSYGYVSLTSGRMKSREGTVVDADDLINEVKGIALEEINKRYENLSVEEKEKRALIIALGAIKFFLLKNDARKDMVFNPEESISFEGETGPYLQYTFARAKSILRKAKKEKINFEKKNFELLEEDKEKELVMELAKFKNNLEKSFELLTLHPITHNLLGIAEKFNSFYHDIQVLKTKEKELLNARLSLVEATIIVLEKGLEILGIELLDEM
jgi:arginyl-tRNA synthetase